PLILIITKLLVMNEVFLETLIELVTSNEKTIQETKGLVKGLPDHSQILALIGARIDRIEKEVREVPNQVSVPVAEIQALKRQLQDHSRLLAIPLKKEVRHEHHMSKPIRWYIALSLVILGLLFLLYHTWDRANHYEENDIKYRYLQVNQAPPGQAYLHEVDSLYNLNPGPFRTEVMQQEEHNKEQLEKLQRLEEQKEGVKELEQDIQAPPVQPGKKAKPNKSGR
ncbi:MAG: hypothetical protein ABUL46_02670, partial [Chitinophaga rupis]